MMNQWRLLSSILWPEPPDTFLSSIQPSCYKNTYYILPYKSSLIKNAVRNNKFHYHAASARNLAQTLDAFLEKHSNFTIIPIPSSSTRTRKRGFDHLLHILDFSKNRDCVKTDVLRKQVNTKPQSHVDKKTRLSQQKDTFACNATVAKRLTGAVILFDDVVTTESTMAAARTSLAVHLPTETKLICLAIAH